ncbi:SAM-dependent methyltransferase [Actinomadura oligospora]|uniref:SAM-dependent methyltransferase n=1 Tax=Actinomadura oligospora TaxID=111804 RepID=UPI00047A9C5B|nr:SAM-dependent methyltransferase [Actinomadura oligospora]
MAEQPPPGIDTSVATAARMYDYYLGGKDNFAVDRDAAERVLSAAPEVRPIALENRRFLQRGVRYLAEQGVTQFLDIGTGLPTQGNVHQIAQAHDPAARVVYVDNDPIVLVHARALLSSNSATKVVTADLRDPDAVLGSASELLDLSRPFALLMAAVLHFVPDSDRPHELVAGYREVLPSGGHLLVSHVTGDTRPQSSAGAAAAYRNTRNPATLRTVEQIAGFFGDFDLAEPGLVPVPRWRPDSPVPSDAEDIWMYGAVGRKP